MTSYTVSNGYTLSGSTLFSGATSVSTILAGSGDVITVSAGGTLDAYTISGGVIVSAVGAGALTSVSAAVLSGDVVAAGGILVENTPTPGKIITTSNLTIDSGGTLSLLGVTNQLLPVYVQSGAEIVFATSTSATYVSSYVGSNVNQTLLVASATTHHNSVTIEGAVSIGVGATSTGGYLFTAQSNSPPICYFEGTLIDTPEGPRPVEAFQEGDLVTVLRNGQPVAEPVRWVGYSRIDLARHARPENAAPIRVKAGALAPQVPVRDLLLSPEHCLILNGTCVPVKLLINGGSIAREMPSAPFSYYHLELDRHGILLAEGAQAESYLDTGNRAMFDNAGTVRHLHPSFDAPTPERWSTDACAPLAEIPGDVAPLWQALAERSAELGYRIPTPALVSNPDVHLIVDGKRVQPTSDRNGRYVFMVPAGAQSVTLGSRFCIPADKMIPGLRDTRRLGLRVDQFSIRTMTDEVIIHADHDSLTAGWHDLERDEATMWRWTDGAGLIPWHDIDGSAVLTIRCAPVAEYPVYDEKLRLVA